VSILLSDWSDLKTAIPLAEKHRVGIELMEFVDPMNLDRYAEVLETLGGVARTVKLEALHGPFADLAPASRDKEIRKATRTRFDTALRIASRLAIGHVVLHSGFMPRTYPPNDWLENSMSFWRDFLPSAPEGIEIHIENVFEDDFAPIRDLVDSIGDRRASICLDIGHVNTNSSRSVADWIRGLGWRIRHVHLHNNHGVSDDHLELGAGTIDVPNALALLRRYAPDATWTVETILARTEASLSWLALNGYMQYNRE
jgi:sugar phosphate isomerase/epimerase